MSKEIFLKKKDLRNWWARTLEHENFAEVLLHVRSEFIEAGPNEAQLAGARLYEAILTTIQNALPTSEAVPGPGLHHQADKEPPMPIAEEPPKKPDPKHIPKPKKGKK